MKKLFTTFLVILTSIGVTQAHASTHLADIYDVSFEEAIQDQIFEIDSEVQQKNMAACNLFANDVTVCGTVSTSLVTYETIDGGIHLHVGWYADGYIATALDGPEAGKQVMVIDDVVIGVSYQMKSSKNYFTHKYSFAEVKSYQYKQTAKFK